MGIDIDEVYGDDDADLCGDDTQEQGGDTAVGFRMSTREEIEKLAVEDFARSGLKPEHLRAEILNEWAARKALGRKNRLPASGAYSIPYFGLDGRSPVLDCGVPYSRVRLLDIDKGSDIGKYLSPSGSWSHPYIPTQLRDALANSQVGKTLVITEGEKKSVAACMAGIPCVALPGVYNFKSQRNAEKDQLAPEIRDLIRQLHEEGAIDTVVVVYDSNGKPMTKAIMPKNAAEFGKGKKTHTVGGGEHVLNPDVYKAANKLAALIRETFNGLPVGVNWVDHAITTVTGPRGGHAFALKDKSRGIDDALIEGCNGEIVALVKETARDAAVIYPDAENEGYIPLGTLNMGLDVALWSNRSENLITLAGKELVNISTLTLIAGSSYLERHFLKMDKQGNVSIDNQRAARAIADDCSLNGRFNEADRVFGTGTWRDDDGGLIVNTDAGVYLQDGTRVPRIAVGRKAIYTREGAFPPPAFRKVPDAEYKAVIQKIGAALDQWQYASGVGCDLVLGWMVMSVFLGAMSTRPSMWLVAPRGSGKTQLAKFIKSCLGGYAWYTDMAKESTGAGIRQMLQRSSSPCIMDEMEKDNTDGMYVNGERAAAAILSLLRSGFSADSDVRKGTADQTGKSFRIMTSFCCVSIADPTLEPADLTRIAKIYLKPIQHNGKIGKPPALMSEEDAAVFYWGTIQRWKLYQALFSEVRDHWLAVAGTGEAREVDTFGVLLAAALASRDCPVSHVRELLDAAVPKLMDQIEEARAASKESDLILETLLSLHVEIQRHETDDRGNERINREKMSVGRALRIAQGRPTGDEAMALADVGLTVTTHDGQQYFAVAAHHASLSKLFQGTRWRMDGAWTGGLREVEGVIRSHTVKFFGRPQRSTLIPLSTLNIQADAPIGGDGSVVSFPNPKMRGFGTTNVNRSDPPSALDYPGNPYTPGPCETDVPF
jgi:hypothetical protein